MATKLAWKTFNPKDIYFHSVSHNNRGQKIVEMSMDPMSTKWSDRVMFQLCDDAHMCESLWGLSPIKDGDDGARREWKVRVNQPESVAKMKELDEHIIDIAYQNREKWFPRREVTREQLAQDKYKGFFRKDEGVAILKVRCPAKDSKSLTQIKLWHDNGSMTDGSYTDCTQFDQVIPIVRIMNVWFMDGGAFGITVQADKLIIKPAKKLSFIDHFHLENAIVFDPDGDHPMTDKDEGQPDITLED
jgi:hypothetical protein